MHARFLGSAFRNRYPKDPTVADVEDPLVESGLLGNDPYSHQIIRTMPQSNIQLNTPEIVKITKPKAKIKPQVRQAPLSPPKILPSITPRRPRTSVSKRLPSNNPVDAPNVYFGSILPANAPPSEVNFMQLNEMLDRLLQSNAVHPEEVYGHIFGDLARQYFIECTAQGDILNKCRTFFTEAKQKLPGIRSHYDDRIKKKEKIIQELEELSKQYGPQVIKNKAHSEHLSQIIIDMREDLKILIGHHDSIIKQVGIASNEAALIKQEMLQLTTKISEKNQELMELNEDLRSLDALSTQYTSDTLRCAENLNMIKKQQIAAHEAIKKKNQELEDSKMKIMLMDREIETFTEQINELRRVPPTSEEEIQCDLVSRRTFTTPAKRRQQKKADGKQSNADEEEPDDLFAKIAQQFAAAALKTNANGEIVINTYEDFAKFKKILLENDAEFRLDPKSLDDFRNGNFELCEENRDYARLFASRIVSDALDKAVNKAPVTFIATQTLPPQQNYEEEREKKRQLKKGKTALLRLTTSDYSNRSAKRLDWLLTEMSTLYDEKAVENEVSLAKHEIPRPFSEFIFEYAKEKYKLEFLTDQYVWDIYITSHEHFDRSLAAEMFVAFIDEQYNEEQLALFLRGRATCIKVGAAVSIKTRDQLESYNEYYLSQEQIEKALQAWWGDRYQYRFYTDILEYSIARPAIHLESTKRYVAMHDLLCATIAEYAKDVVRRLNENLVAHRIVPRLSQTAFRALCFNLIPVLTESEVAEFYRSTVTKSKQRTDIDEEDFIAEFREGCLLFHMKAGGDVEATSRVNEAGEEEYEDPRRHETFKAVSDLWYRAKATVVKILEFFQGQRGLQPDNATLKMYYDDALRFQSMLSHSLSTGDGPSSSIHFFKLLFTLDVMYSALGPMRADLIQPSLLSIECAIRESWLDSVFTI